MNPVTVLNQIPEKSIISKDFGKIHYSDSYKIQVTSNETVDAITTKIFSVPQWVKGLLKFRNSIVKVFGLKTDSKTEKPSPYYPIGSKAILFTVTDRNEFEIVMAENDKHLNFRTSVMIEKVGEITLVYLTTIVKFNNSLGRLYFLPVKPFHKLMIKSLLKRYSNEKRILSNKRPMQERLAELS